MYDVLLNISDLRQRCFILSLYCITRILPNECMFNNKKNTQQQQQQQNRTKIGKALEKINSLKDNLVTFYDITGVIKTYLRNIKIKTNYVPIIFFYSLRDFV